MSKSSVIKAKKKSQIARLKNFINRLTENKEMTTQDILQKGIEKGYIKFDEEKKYITYIHPNKRYRFQDPEEKIRATVYLQLLFDYNYPAHRIDVELTVPRRTPSDLADIVVFEDDIKKKPYIVVECKKSTATEAEFLQAIEQGFGNAVSLGADWVWVTSGLKSRYFSVDRKNPLEREKNIEATIPAFGKDETSLAKYYYGGIDENGSNAFELEVVPQDELTRIFAQAHQALWAGGKRNPSEAFDELDKLIFCKLWDEKKDRKEGTPYDVQEYKGEDPEFLLARVRAIYETGRLKDQNVFNEPIRLSAKEVKTVVGYFAKVNLGDSDLDSKGRAFETFLGSFFRGDFGQYFTPREVVDFIVKVLPIDNCKYVLDTSCGSGGFLLYALDKVRAQANKLYPKYKTDTKQGLKHWKYWHDFAQNNLFGIEISESIARTAKMNMIIHDDGHTNVVSADGLLPADYRHPRIGETEEEKAERENYNRNTLPVKVNNSDFKYNHFDFIITNPPFGSVIKRTEQGYMKNFKMSLRYVDWIERRVKNNLKYEARDSQNTEVLFIEQCYRFLKPGGMLAMVVPDGILTNSSAQYVREWIEEHYRIIAVVSLPQDAFKANDAGVKSSVLFLKKLRPDETDAIVSAKEKLQERLWEKPEYNAAIRKLQTEHAATLKGHKGFAYNSINWESEDNLKNLAETPAEQQARVIELIATSNEAALLSGRDLKVVEKTEEFKIWKAEITAQYNESLEVLKEELQDEYVQTLGKEITNYPVFMAITENIGYDSTGRKTGVNELNTVAVELQAFIEAIQKGQDSFFD